MLLTIRMTHWGCGLPLPFHQAELIAIRVGDYSQILSRLPRSP